MFVYVIVNWKIWLKLVHTFGLRTYLIQITNNETKCYSKSLTKHLNNKENTKNIKLTFIKIIINPFKGVTLTPRTLFQFIHLLLTIKKYFHKLIGETPLTPFCLVYPPTSSNQKYFPKFIRIISVGGKPRAPPL